MSIKQSAIKKALNINRPITIATEAWWEEKCIGDLLHEVNFAMLPCWEKSGKSAETDFPATSKEVCAVSVPKPLPNLSLSRKKKENFATESEKNVNRRKWGREEEIFSMQFWLPHRKFPSSLLFYGIFMRIWWLYCVWTWDFFPFTFQPSLENFLFNWKVRISEWKLLFRDRGMDEGTSKECLKSEDCSFTLEILCKSSDNLLCSFEHFTPFHTCCHPQKLLNSPKQLRLYRESEIRYWLTSM